MKPGSIHECWRARWTFSPVLRGGLIEAGRWGKGKLLVRQFSPVLRGGLIEAVERGPLYSFDTDGFPPCFAGASLKRADIASGAAAEIVFPRASRGPH